MVDFVHEALLYRDDAEFVAGTVPFVREGLDNGEPVLVAVPPQRAELLRPALGPHAAEVEFVDITRVGRNPGRILPGVLTPFCDDARNARADRVRVVEEQVWPGRSALEYPACVQHEALVNTALTDRRAWLLCPYDATRLTAGQVRDAERTHPVVHREPNPDYGEPFAVAEEFNVPLPPPPPDAVVAVFDLGRLDRVRALVADFAVGLAADRVEDLVLAVNELTTNSVLHAAGAGTVLLWREGAVVVCEVRDEGGRTGPMVGRRRPDATSRGGFGVVLVHLVCDLVRVHTHAGGTAVRVHLG
ncbi:anti-sigma factor RsbA family regulatory protein [Actinosynnema sp. NPDC020468]|uniref:anti-sigma factor RsbA family regulatory protein n=1 Tax=Actinosynnema sp. NPDC020468 TaxID=3154488 RepID=UPI0033E93BF6